MKTEIPPAFYALRPTSAWREYVNLLHIPYTLWHLSYLVLGAALAPTLHLDRLLASLVAFSLAMGIGAHALDELNGRPLGTRIAAWQLGALAAASLGAAIVLGLVAALTVSIWMLPFVAFGGFIAVAYNLGLWHGRLHSDFWFAFAWGAFPALASYWINATSLSVAAVLLACGCFTLSLAQRVLSTQVRTVRRRALDVQGRMEMADGSVVALDAALLILAPEKALRLMCVTIVVLSASLLAFRL